MTRNCGLSKLFVFLVAALFCLTLAGPQAQAQNIKIGPGVQDPCYDGDNGGVPTPLGWCDILSGSVNVILGDTFNWYQNTDQNTNLVSPLVLGFAVPVENLLEPFFGGPVLNGPVTGSALTDPAKFVDDSLLPCWNTDGCAAALAGAPDVDISFPTSPVALDFSSIFADTPNVFPNGFPGGFTQGTLFAVGETGASGVVAGNTSVYDFLGLPSTANSNHPNNWANASTEIPAIVLECGVNPLCEGPEDFITPSGWTLWLFALDEHDLVAAKDAIQFIYDESELPLGTWVFAWAVAEKCTGQTTTPDCDKNYFGMSMTESAFLMPLPEGGEVPEPTSLLLLGTGLLAVGRQWRKKQQSRKQDVV